MTEEGAHTTDAHVSYATEGTTVRIKLDGEIDMANAPAVENEIFEAITNQVTAASIDLTDITYLDSAGLRILFGLAVRLPTLQIDLELVAPVGGPARRLMELSGLNEVAAIRPDAS